MNLVYPTFRSCATFGAQNATFYRLNPKVLDSRRAVSLPGRSWMFPRSELITLHGDVTTIIMTRLQTNDYRFFANLLLFPRRAAAASGAVDR
jgi:hypothetical protein